ncbi:hypothetical protein PV326_010128 [Microctonus aethiopoides]|nr:hypothetical protein PV326_010128 [Microctonus aethiopoides]
MFWIVRRCFLIPLNRSGFIKVDLPLVNILSIHQYLFHSDQTLSSLVGYPDCHCLFILVVMIFTVLLPISTGQERDFDLKILDVDPDFPQLGQDCSIENILEVLERSRSGRSSGQSNKRTSAQESVESRPAIRQQI